MGISHAFTSFERYIYMELHMLIAYYNSTEIIMRHVLWIISKFYLNLNEYYICLVCVDAISIVLGDLTQHKLFYKVQSNV